MKSVMLIHSRSFSCKELLKFVYKLCMLLLFLSSLKMWILWNVERIVEILALLVSVIVYVINNKLFFLTKNKLIIILFACIFFLYKPLIMGEIIGIFGAFVSIVIFSILVLSNTEFKIHLLLFVTKGFAIILMISLSFFLAYYLLHIPLSFTYVEYANQYNILNYNLFITLISDVNSLFIIPRFQAVFVEPGHLGMISSFLLYIQSFNLKKWYNTIIFISAIFTFSLAAYVLILIGFVMFNMIENRMKFMRMLLMFLVVSSVGVLIVFKIDKDSMINQLILERLVIENGDIVGNNRFSYDFDREYNEKIITSDKWLGWQPDFSVYKGGNAGYKRYIANYGIIGFVFFVLFYISCCRGYTIYSISLFLLYLIAFIQRAYPYWECELIPFICGVPFIELINSNIAKYSICNK